MQINLVNSTGSLFAAAQVNNNNPRPCRRRIAAGAHPVAGSQFRFYLTNSPRLFVEGNVYGMYLFGYGNFVSTSDTIRVTDQAPQRECRISAGIAAKR